MNITRFAIDRNRVSLTLLAILIIGGILAYINAPRSEDPGFTIRTALVVTYFPGAGPERVEQLVTEKLEQSIQEIEELDYLKSESRTGQSVIYVNIKDRYFDIQSVWDEVRRKVERTARTLPDGIHGPYVNDEFGEVFGITLALRGEGYSMAELKDHAEDIQDQLLQVQDVAQVQIHGTREERIYLEFDNAKLSQYGISALQLRDILQSQNILYPGGAVNINGEELTIEPSGNFESLKELRQTVIPLPESGQVVYLQDLVDIKRGYLEPAGTKVTYKGEPALMLAISMREGGNIVDMGRKVEQKVKQLQAQYPIGLEMDYLNRQPQVVDTLINDFVFNLLQSIAIVILVMLASLGLRTGFLVSSVIPVTILTAFMIMRFLGIGIDIVSVGALLVALGILVDNSIVISESIMVQVEEGKTKRKAAIDSAKELWRPLLTSTLTTTSAFLPIFLSEDITGEYTSPLFKVVGITLLSSWILSLTLIPLFAVLFLKLKKTDDAPSGKRARVYNRKIFQYYRKALLLALRHKFVSLGSLLVLLLMAAAAFNLVPKKFFPNSDQAVLRAELELPAGTRIEKTEELVKQYEDFINARYDTSNIEANRGVTNWGSYIGFGGPRFKLTYTPEPQRPNYAILIVNFTSREAMMQAIPEFKSYANKHFPDLKDTYKPLQKGPPVDSPVAIRIKGKEIDQLFRIADRVKDRLSQAKGTHTIDDNWGISVKKLKVDINRPKALRAGVTNKDVAVSLQSALRGIQTTEYREGSDIIPVTLRAKADYRNSIDKLEGLNIVSQREGKTVPLGQVADVSLDFEPSKIIRRDQYRCITVTSELTDGYTANDVIEEMKPWLNNRESGWGMGYSYEIGGEVEKSSEANANILSKVPYALLVIFLLLMLQFNSFRKTLILALVVPSGIIGVVVGLLIFDSYFGFMTLLGVISLAGIIINNANVLLDRIRIEQQEFGSSPEQAVLNASQRRFRPILMTTATTIGGLIPLYLGGGPLWEPLAIAMIVGLMFATTLTLGLAPVLYALLYRLDFSDEE